MVVIPSFLRAILTLNEEFDKHDIVNMVVIPSFLRAILTTETESKEQGRKATCRNPFFSQGYSDRYISWEEAVAVLWS